MFWSNPEQSSNKCSGRTAAPYSSPYSYKQPIDFNKRAHKTPAHCKLYLLLFPCFTSLHTPCPMAHSLVFFIQINVFRTDSCGPRHFTEFYRVRKARHPNGHNAQTRLTTGELVTVRVGIALTYGIHKTVLLRRIFHVTCPDLGSRSYYSTVNISPCVCSSCADDVFSCAPRQSPGEGKHLLIPA